MIQELNDKEELLKAADLATLCFHDQINDAKKALTQNHELEMFGYYKESNLLAAAGSYKFQIFIRDNLFDCAGFAYVMTHPSERRRGYVKELMNKILVDRKKQGYPLAALWPFDHTFYEKFGFGNAEKSINYVFKPGEIKSSFKLEERIRVTDVTDENDFTPLKEITHNAVNKYTRIVGEKDAWLLRGSLGGKFKIYLLEREEIPIAYVSFKFVKKGEWDYHMTIMDFAYIDLNAKFNLMGFLRNFSADINKISTSFPVQEEIESYLDGVKDTHKFNQWPSMVRILDIKKCFEQLDYNPSINEELYFKTEDKILTENTGIWKLQIENGKGHISKVEQIESIPNEILDLTINQLSQVLVGYSNIEKLLESHSKRIPNSWRQKELFPEKACSFMLWF
jgi:predicted acetyltransferase